MPRVFEKMHQQLETAFSEAKGPKGDYNDNKMMMILMMMMMMMMILMMMMMFPARPGYLGRCVRQLVAGSASWEKECQRQVARY